jgi:hypothetical protein
MVELGKLLLVLGGLIIVVGALLLVGGRLPPGHLPGDIVVRDKHWVFYFPLATCIVISVILSLVLWLFSRGSR